MKLITIHEELDKEYVEAYMQKLRDTEFQVEYDITNIAGEFLSDIVILQKPVSVNRWRDDEIEVVFSPPDDKGKTYTIDNYAGLLRKKTMRLAHYYGFDADRLDYYMMEDKIYIYVCK